MKLRILVVALVVAGWCAYRSGSWLVLDQPERSDLILVLAGETDRRPARALELLRQGYAPRILLDAPDEAVYQSTTADLARRYAESVPESRAIAVCTVHGLSTREESGDVARCLQSLPAAPRILLVTSDYHSRRALSVFEHRLRDHRWSVAAAYDARQYGVRWWQNRQWAKTWLQEWMKYAWWEAVERWM